MAPVKNLAKKNKADENEEPKDKIVKSKEKGKRWTNKQRVLVFSSRGVSFRSRHLMMDLRTLMPHSRAENKLHPKVKLTTINEISEMKNCNHCILFQMKKKKDLYMWVASVPHGPSARFLVENVHTMDELKLTGNCLKGSRPILSFDKCFDESKQYSLLKEMFTQMFGTPNMHPKSKPFVDRVMTFTVVDHRLWIRNYQIVDQKEMTLQEIGPRFVLNLIRIFSGSFGGSTLYENPLYESPNDHRRNMYLQASTRYVQKKKAKERYGDRLVEREDFVEESLDDIFHTVTQADIFEAQNKK